MPSLVIDDTNIPAYWQRGLWAGRWDEALEYPETDVMQDIGQDDFEGEEEKFGGETEEFNFAFRRRKERKWKRSVISNKLSHVLYFCAIFESIKDIILILLILNLLAWAWQAMSSDSKQWTTNGKIEN